jgi:hypothetical protein
MNKIKIKKKKEMGMLGGVLRGEWQSLRQLWRKLC